MYTNVLVKSRTVLLNVGCLDSMEWNCEMHNHMYRIISNISTVLYFFNLPPPRAIIGDVPLLETVPLLFQPHFRGMLPLPNSCQTHASQGFYAGTDNEFTQCAYNGD